MTRAQETESLSVAEDAWIAALNHLLVTRLEMRAKGSEETGGRRLAGHPLLSRNGDHSSASTTISSKAGYKPRHDIWKRPWR